jgi:hypothetical protein
MFVALTLAVTLLAQSDEPKPVESVSCPSQVVLPMQDSARQAPVINLEIGGKTYKFALDTGATGGRISKSIIESLGLKPVGVVQAGDPSGKNVRQVNIYKIPEIKAGGATLHGVQMFADDGVAPRGSKEYFDGVIGYAVFHDLLLTLDYPNKQVILTPNGMSAMDRKQSIPYALEHGIPFLQVQVGDIKVGGHVDSGADGALSIPDKYRSKLHLDGDPVLVGHARTLFNTVDIYLAKVKDPISVGGMKLPIHEVELNGLFPVANIGGRVLHQFRVVIDQKKQRIAFESPKT